MGRGDGVGCVVRGADAPGPLSQTSSFRVAGKPEVEVLGPTLWLDFLLASERAVRDIEAQRTEGRECGPGPERKKTFGSARVRLRSIGVEVLFH